MDVPSLNGFLVKLLQYIGIDVFQQFQPLLAGRFTLE
jgi:hypothetical protein